MRRTWAFGHFLVGCEGTLLLYGFDEIVQRLVEIQTGCMLDLFSDGRPVYVVQDRGLKTFRQAFEGPEFENIGETGAVPFQCKVAGSSCPEARFSLLPYTGAEGIPAVG